MATQVQLRRGTTAENDAFTGAQGELTFDTNNKEVRVHDGATNGGFPLAKEAGATFGNTNVTGDFSFADNAKAIFGAGSDLQIYHDGFNSVIHDAGTGVLKLRATDFRLSNADNTKDYLAANDGAAVNISYNGAVKLATTATGVDVTGTVTADGLTVDGDATISSGTPTLQLTDTGGTNQFATFKQDGSNLKILSRNNTASGGILMRRNVGGTETDAIQLSANGDISFYDTSGVTQGLFWDASTQRLGLGTTSTVYGKFTVQNTDGTGKVLLDSYQSVPTTENVMAIYADASNGYIESYNNGYKNIIIAGSGGNLLVGTTSATTPFDGCRIAIDANSSDGIRVRSSGVPMRFIATGTSTFVGSISTTASTTSYNTSSDYRLKENVVADWDATTRLKQLNPVRFNFIADPDTTVDGFLAHEVSHDSDGNPLVPEAITGTKDGMRDEEYEVTPAVLDEDGNEVTPAVMGTLSVPDYQGIDQSKLVPLLVKTIQELEARIAALEAN
jgi:hypothetical protein